MASIFGMSGEAGKNIAKLGLIATGVGASVTILSKMLKFAMESSGHMAATSKLWDTGMRMIFRPMGDTIGLVLRPFALMMIKWAVPFYQKFSEEIPEIMEGADEISEGQVFGGSAKVGGSVLDLIFGEGAGDNWKSNQNALQSFMNWLTGSTDTLNDKTEEGGGFFDWIGKEIDKLFSIPSAYADTGEAVAETNKEMDSFTQWLKDVADEIKKRTTLEGLGIEPGSDFTSTGQGNAHSKSRQHFGSNKLLSRNVYEKMVETRGQSFADSFLEARGYDGISSGQTGNTTAKNPRGGSAGITVNIDKATMEDPNLGAKIQAAVQKEMKKLPGRR